MEKDISKISNTKNYINQSDLLLSQLHASNNVCNSMDDVKFNNLSLDEMVDFYVNDLVNELSQFCTYYGKYSVTFNPWPPIKDSPFMYVSSRLNTFLFRIISENSIKETFNKLIRTYIKNRNNNIEDLSIFNPHDFVRIYSDLFNSNKSEMFIILSNKSRNNNVWISSLNKRNKIMKVSQESLLSHNPEYYYRAIKSKKPNQFPSSEIVNNLMCEYNEFFSNSTKYSIKYYIPFLNKQINAKPRLKTLCEIIGTDLIIEKLNRINNIVTSLDKEQLEKYPLYFSIGIPHIDLAKISSDEKSHSYGVEGYDVRKRLITLYNLTKYDDSKNITQSEFLRLNPEYFSQILNHHPDFIKRTS